MRERRPHRLLPSVDVATLDPHPPNPSERFPSPPPQAHLSPDFRATAEGSVCWRLPLKQETGARCLRCHAGDARSGAAADHSGSKETTRMRLVRLARAIPRVRTPATTATTDLVAELKVGDALRTYRRRFTEGDVEAYAELSGHCSPVHVDDDAIDRWPGAFRKGSVVHGMLVASLFPAVIASHFPGAVYASQSLRFAAPVFAGDVVLPQVQVLHIKATGERHIVKFATSASCMMKLLSSLTAWPWLSCPHLSAMRRQSSDKKKCQAGTIQTIKVARDWVG